MTAYSVLDYLANMSNAPSDFLSGSYEPTIGMADGGDAGTRIVNTNDMETAAIAALFLFRDVRLYKRGWQSICLPA